MDSAAAMVRGDLTLGGATVGTEEVASAFCTMRLRMRWRCRMGIFSGGPIVRGIISVLDSERRRGLGSLGVAI